MVMRPFSPFNGRARVWQAAALAEPWDFVQIESTTGSKRWCQFFSTDTIFQA
jgi:hypothetical protein